MIFNKGRKRELVKGEDLLGFGGKASYTMVPWTTYTKPEVAHVGYTQPWAEQLGIYKDSMIFQLEEIDRAKADNDRYGFF